MKRVIVSISIFISLLLINCTSSVKPYMPESFTIPTASITIDGNFDDWNAIEPVFVDMVNDQDQNADFDGTDLYKFYLARDDTFLYIMMTLYDGEPKTDITTVYIFQANQSTLQADSQGDRFALAGFSDEQWFAEVCIKPSGDSIAYYPSEYIGVGSKFIEWKVRLSDMEILNGRFVRVYTHVVGDGSNTEYPVSDENITNIKLIAK